MDTLILVRHALAASNRDATASCVVPGAGLTSEGVEQALTLRALLADEPIDLAAATELARTQETLRLAIEGRDIPVLVVPELNEIHFGHFEAGLLETYRAWAAAHAPLERPGGSGESRADAASRFARGLTVVLERDEKTVLLVGHALALRYVLDAAEGLLPAALMKPVPHAAPRRLDRGDVERAADVLVEWSRSPRFADRSF